MIERERVWLGLFGEGFDGPAWRRVWLGLIEEGFRWAC